MMTVLVVIYVVFISLGLPDSLLGVAWPVLHGELNVPESFASVFSIIVGICTGGVSFVSGTLIRKFGTARVTLASIFITALGLVGISFAPNIAVMILFSVILGYGAGAIDTGVNNFVSGAIETNGTLNINANSIDVGAVTVEAGGATLAATNSMKIAHYHFKNLQKLMN